jgi:hypothetical protein
VITRMLNVVILSSLAVFGAGMAQAGLSNPTEAAPDETRSRELLSQTLAGFKDADQGQVIPLPDETLGRTFAGHRFYVLRFRQYPIAVLPPAPLRTNNVFVVKPDGSVGHLADVAALEAFFRAKLPPVTTTAEATGSARAWLLLVQEFHQDGFLQFSIPGESVNIVSMPSGGREVTAKAVVMPHGGNQGEIVASLTFDGHGKLVTLSESANIKRGIRPICQVTKLLDPDPIVRAMAEQAILVMGRTAGEYLDEERARATPELREAIDRLWRRILEEDR